MLAEMPETAIGWRNEINAHHAQWPKRGTMAAFN